MTKHSSQRHHLRMDTKVLGWRVRVITAQRKQNGNMKLRRRLIGGSWSDFSSWKSVISSKYMSSPVVVLRANSESIAFGAYDTRVAHEIPVISIEWQSRLGNVVGICSGGVEKVYIRDDNAGTLTVGDLRNVKTPLEKLTEYCRR
ncbi:hypothetical protein LguiA_032450 [Lonicera macranthoides]